MRVRKPPPYFWGNCAQVHGVLRESVIARNGLAVGSEHEHGGYALRDVLPCLLLQVVVERFHTTRETRPIVLWSESLNLELWRRHSIRRLSAATLMVSLCRPLRCGGGRRRIPKSLGKGFPRCAVQAQHFAISDGIRCRLLGARHHEFRHRRSAKPRRAHDDSLLCSCDSCFQALQF